MMARLLTARAGRYAKPWTSARGVLEAFWSLALLRRDINVRESTVLGLVGAGGIGVAVQTAMGFFQSDPVALILLMILSVVMTGELAVDLIRSRII